MKTTVSSKSNKLFDLIRGQYVAATPEEKVRQALICRMIGPLGFSKGLIAVEKEVCGTKRRADIVSYRLASEGVCPLLVVECKKEGSLFAAKEQALGYNFRLGAPFFCVASSTEIHTMWFEGTLLKSVPFLPAFHELSEMAERHVQR